jgi:glycosyltransferase involved in cell wall biosynthesis
MTTPLVSVLLPVFNGEMFLKEAIESILNQSYTFFEFLIINDGSTDHSTQIIQSYHDNRINCFELPRNEGLVYALNFGLEQAKGKYIVRMDADDIAFPERIEHSVGFMEHNPDVGACGTWFQTIGNSEFDLKFPTDHDSLMATLLFYNPICHPSAIIRKKVLDDHNLSYDDSYPDAEDYKLWTVVAGFTKLANLGEKLLFYRQHANQISRDTNETQIYSSVKIRKELLERICDQITDPEMLTWEELIKQNKAFRNPENTIILVEKVLTCNLSGNIFSQSALLELLKYKWKKAWMDCLRKGIFHHNSLTGLLLRSTFRWQCKIW